MGNCSGAQEDVSESKTSLRDGPRLRQLGHRRSRCHEQEAPFSNARGSRTPAQSLHRQVLHRKPQGLRRVGVLSVGMSCSPYQPADL